MATDDGTGTDQGQTGASTGNAESPAPAKIYTQADMDKAAGEMTARHSRALSKRDASAVSSFLTQRGFGSAEDLQDALDQKSVDADASAEAVKSAKKWEREAKAFQARAEASEASFSAIKVANDASKVKSAIFEAADKVNANPKLTYALAMIEGKFSVDDDGSVHVHGDDGEPLHGMTVGKFVEQLVASSDSALKKPSPGVGSGTRSSQQRATTDNGADPASRDAQLANLVAQLAAKGITA